MAPQAPFTPAYKLWVVWLAAAVALLMAKPWGTFGWDEWLAIAAPLLLLHPAIRRLDVFVLGLLGSGLAWYFLSDESGGWPELACLLLILFAGTAVGYYVMRRGPGATTPAGELISSEKLFFDALNREMCRTRRDCGSFAVLSLDLNGIQPDTTLEHVLEFLDAELRSYADIARVGDRILALVPGVGDGQAQPMLNRLLNKWATTREGELSVGLARFPQDAICAQDLIDHADRKRLVREISPLPVEQSQPQPEGQLA